MFYVLYAWAFPEILFVFNVIVLYEHLWSTLVLIIHSVCLSIIIIRAVSQTVGWACRPTTWTLWSAWNRWQADLWASWLWRTYTTPHSILPHALQVTNQHTQTHWKGLLNTCLETSPLCWNVDAITVIHSHTQTHKFLLPQKVSG